MCHSSFSLLRKGIHSFMTKTLCIVKCEHHASPSSLDLAWCSHFTIQRVFVIKLWIPFLRRWKHRYNQRKIPFSSESWWKNRNPTRYIIENAKTRIEKLQHCEVDFIIISDRNGKSEEEWFLSLHANIHSTDIWIALRHFSLPFKRKIPTLKLAHTLQSIKKLKYTYWFCFTLVSTAKFNYHYISCDLIVVCSVYYAGCIRTKL